MSNVTREGISCLPPLPPFSLISNSRYPWLCRCPITLAFHAVYNLSRRFPSFGALPHNFRHFQAFQIVELDGYWQSAEYFVHNLDMIRQLMWNEDTAVQAQVVLDGWLEREPPVGQLVGVHLRLGDYIGASRNLNMSYYREAFEAVKTARNDTQLTCLLFSDDIVLAQKVGEEFEACNKVIPAVPCPDPWNNKYHCHGREVGDWVQFYMMSQLDNLIIADSSYSFWSAVLSPKKPLVVVPRITWPLGVASRGDYAYLNNPMYGWVNIDARLGDPDSKAVRMEHLHLALDRSGVPPSEWAA
ncbi:unnamed protein product [Prorocentrum cordatum]|uniref:Uncharacterized protein n=1 Tax=Prorocentrum cordatum TaxID=2364126 RepID=A0ABN9THA0_9DINO|nr:unnamed protein product [Polarella glacialis]